MQSTDSSRELNAKLLVEIAELRKENAEIPELREKLLKFAEVEGENVRLKQIIEENARRDAENAELKSRVGELKARLALLEQGSAVDEMVLSFGQTQNGDEAMPTVDVPDSVIDQLNNEVGRAPSDLMVTMRKWSISWMRRIRKALAMRLERGSGKRSREIKRHL